MNDNQSKPVPIKTVLIITVGFLVVSLITKAKWPLMVSSSVGILGLASDYLAAKIDFVWSKLTWVLSQIVPKILIAAVFYVFLTPIALISRIFGAKNQLSLKNVKPSLFKETDKTFSRDFFEKPW